MHIRLIRQFVLIAICMIAMADPAAADPTQEVLALVNDIPITRADLMIEQAHLEKELRLRNDPIPKGQMRAMHDQMLENLIDRELLFQHAQEKNIQIRARWVTRALAEFKARMGSDKQFATFLEQAQLDEAQVRDRLSRGLIVQRLLRRDVARGIKVSEAEMQTFYRHHPEYFQRSEQIRIRHILIRVEENDNLSQRGEALLKIQNIQSLLQEGANFGALALDYSEDQSRQRGGDLGVVTREQLVPAFAQAAFSLQPGEISDIVETRFGYHLIQMVERIPSSTMVYRNARTKIERTLRRNKEKAAADRYIARLRAASTIAKQPVETR